MAISITTLSVTEGYASLTVLTQAQLNLAVSDTETYCNVKLRYNLMQLAKDIMDNATYTFNDDGNPHLVTPLIHLCAKLADNETITGQWTFSDVVTFTSRISGGANTIVSVTGQPRCRAYVSTANQSLADTTLTAMSMTAESYDVGDLHSNATNPSRITVGSGKSGIYSFNAQATFAASNVGFRTLALYKNGSKVCETKEFSPHATEQTVLNIHYQDEVAVNDYYEAYVYQSSGGALDLVHTVSFFAATKVW